MKFRTSWFNPTLALHHWKRFWPLPAGMLLWCLCSYVLSLVNQLSYWRSLPEAERLSFYCAALEDIAMTLPALLAVGAAVAALLVFRYLHSRSASQFYMLMPMKRRCLWLTGTVSGWLMAILPMLLTILILLCFTAGNGLPAAPVLRLLLFGLSCWTISYALAVISCILAGNIAGALLIDLGINCALYVLSACAGSIAGWFVNGYSGGLLFESVVLWLTPAAKLLECVSCDSTPLGVTVPLIYLAAGILLLALSGVLYQLRKAENAGETVAFRQLHTICKVEGALLVSLLGTLFLESCLSLSGGISFAGIVLLVLLCLTIGWFAAAMLIRRSFRVFDRRELAGLAAAALSVLLILAAGRLDICGYCSNIPDLSQVTSAQLECDSAIVELEPQELLALHETILEHREELISPSSSESYYTVSLEYRLENGKTCTRSYCLPARYLRQETGTYNDDEAYLPAGIIYDTIMETLQKPENNLQTWFPGWSAAPDPSRFLYATVSRNTDASGAGISAAISADQAQTVYEAFTADLEAGNVAPYCMSDASFNPLYIIELDYQTQSFAESGCSSYKEYMENTPECCAYLYVSADMTNTLAALEACGIAPTAAG